MISIVGLEKADVLRALYDAARPQGMGFMHYDPKPMTREEAAGFLARTTYFDYVNGRVMKVNLSGDEFEPRLYDRDNGAGAAQRVIDALRELGVPDPRVSKPIHEAGKAQAAAIARDMMERPTSESTDGDVRTLELGLDDVKDVLSPKIDEAVGKE